MKNKPQGGWSGGPIKPTDNNWCWALALGVSIFVGVVILMMLGDTLAEQNEQTQETRK